MLCLAAGAAWPVTAQRIVQPGAPGQPSRIITAEQSAALARTPVLPADVAFMRHMIVHHGQALDMVALIAARSGDRDVRLMGERIARSQASEIALMRGWLQDRGGEAEPAAAAHDHATMGMPMPMGDGPGGAVPADPDRPMMTGMLSRRQMAALAAARGPAFDRLFLGGMIRHHQGALDMIHQLVAMPGAGEEAMLSEFLIAIAADQNAEITRMRAMLGAPGS